MREENTFLFELTPNEYRRLGNMLVRIAETSKRIIDASYSDRTDYANYKDAVLFMDKLGIPESEVAGNEAE